MVVLVFWQQSRCKNSRLIWKDEKRIHASSLNGQKRIPACRSVWPTHCIGADTSHPHEEQTPPSTEYLPSLCLCIQAVSFADIPVMAAYLVLVGFVFVVINLIVDLLYYVVDPRLRIDRERAAGV